MSDRESSEKDLVREGHEGGASKDAAASPPSRIGRYVVIETLGEGGMGVVYRTFDPELNRSVAVKVVHVRTSSPGQRQEAQTRLLREGQALAQVTHRNVVAVYDVGLTKDGDVFIAMEHVDGQSLAKYCAGRSWADVVAVYRGAADGLAACHRRGLVHRDFKPSNVMVDCDGRAVILDFGLARAGYDDDASVDEESKGGDSPPLTPVLLQSPLTARGVVRGTPAYMSPEQFQGTAVGPASDQFSFCVALWFALFQQRPFSGKTAAAIKKNVLEGELERPSDSRTVPAWIRDILAKGLANDASHRWASMEELSETLGDDPSIRRRRRLVAAAALSVIASAVAALAFAGGALDAPVEQRCTGSAGYMAGVWDSERRKTIANAFEKLDVPYAEKTWLLARNRIDRYSLEWQSSHRDVCEATALRGEQTNEVMAVRMKCLHRIRRTLEATVDVLETADAAIVPRVHKLTSGLPTLEQCDDLTALLEKSNGPSGSDWSTVDAAETFLTDAEVLRKAGRNKEALEKLDAAFTSLEDVEYPPLRARLMLERASLLTAAGKPAQAEDETHELIRYASEHGQRGVMATAATDLMWLLAETLRRPDDALQHASWAAGLAAGSRKREAHFQATLAAVHYRKSNLEPARAAATRALELYIAEFGPDHHYVPATRVTLASIMRSGGHIEDSVREGRRAIAEFTASLGEGHPFVGITRGNVGNALAQLGRFEESEKELRQAFEIVSAAWGVEHPHSARAAASWAAALEHRGEYEAAEETLRQAIRFKEKTYPASHPQVVEAKLQLASLRLTRGAPADAERLARMTLAAAGEPTATSAALLVRGRVLLARTARLRGALDQANLETKEIVADAERLESEEGALPLALRERAVVLMELGQKKTAVELLQRALAAPGASALSRAETKFALARALWKEDVKRARGLAKTARSHANAETKSEIETWLAAR